MSFVPVGWLVCAVGSANAIGGDLLTVIEGDEARALPLS